MLPAIVNWISNSNTCRTNITIITFENDNLVERERGLDLLIWDFLDEAVVFEYFSIEKATKKTHQLQALKGRNCIQLCPFRAQSQIVVFT